MLTLFWPLGALTAVVSAAVGSTGSTTAASASFPLPFLAAFLSFFDCLASP